MSDYSLTLKFRIEKDRENDERMNERIIFNLLCPMAHTSQMTIGNYGQQGHFRAIFQPEQSSHVHNILSFSLVRSEAHLFATRVHRESSGCQIAINHYYYYYYDCNP